jgi:hypothetical protein
MLKFTTVIAILRTIELRGNGRGLEAVRMHAPSRMESGASLAVRRGQREYGNLTYSARPPIGTLQSGRRLIPLKSPNSW